MSAATIAGVLVEHEDLIAYIAFLDLLAQRAPEGPYTVHCLQPSGAALGRCPVRFRDAHSKIPAPDGEGRRYPITSYTQLDDSRQLAATYLFNQLRHYHKVEVKALVAVPLISDRVHAHWRGDRSAAIDFSLPPLTLARLLGEVMGVSARHFESNAVWTSNRQSYFVDRSRD